MLPLHAAHPAQHDRDTFPISAFNHGLVCNLQLPSNEIQSKILDVAHHGSVAVGVILKKEIWSVGRTADQVVAAINLQIKIASAAANFRKAGVLIAGLRDLANAEVNLLSVRTLAIQYDIHFQVIQVRLTPAVRPPQIRIGNRELRDFGRGEGNLGSFRRPHRYFLFESNRSLARARNLATKNS